MKLSAPTLPSSRSRHFSISHLGIRVRYPHISNKRRLIDKSKLATLFKLGEWYGFMGYYYSPNCGGDGRVDGQTWTDSYLQGHCYEHSDMYSIGMGNTYGNNYECNCNLEVQLYHEKGCSKGFIKSARVYKSACVGSQSTSIKSFQFVCPC